MIARSGASFCTKSSIFSLTSKMMTMSVSSPRATKNDPMNFPMIYLSSFLISITAVASRY